MIKIEKRSRHPIFDSAEIPPLYRLIIDGVVVRENLSFDEAIEAIEAVCRQDEEAKT